MARVVVLGAGVMGLAAAWEAQRAGHAVTVLEAGPEPGGMAAHAPLGPLSVERYYHFVCKTDTPLFDLLAELGLADRLRWRPTSMGYFTRGALHRWGDPIALLRFPHLTLLQKIRYGLLTFVSTRRDAWPALEYRTARGWIEAWCGRAVYDLMWRPLFHYKFYEWSDVVSAAWIWTRIRRIGRSRRSLFQEELGYIEGGSETLVRALVQAIADAGGTIRLGEPARRIDTAEGRVTGVTTAAGAYAADAVICTVPAPLVPDLAPDLPEADRESYRAMRNTGVVCVVLRLARSVSPHFWVNVNEPDIEIPGIIEFSRLRALDDHVVYVPFYMPTWHEKWARPDAAFVEESLACLQRINPAVTRADLLDARVSRLRHAQPICPAGFAATLPPVRTAIGGLQVADTCFYYPEDRGTAESVRFGRIMGKDVLF